MILHLAVGMILGGILGTIIMSMLFIAKKSEDNADEMNGNDAFLISQQDVTSGNTRGL